MNIFCPFAKTIILLFSRQLAESSPYYETFKSRNFEVLFVYDVTDELALISMPQFQMKKVFHNLCYVYFYVFSLLFFRSDRKINLKLFAFVNYVWVFLCASINFFS